MDRCAPLGRHVGGVEDVLDADRDAMQRPERRFAPARGVKGRSLSTHHRRIDEGPGFQLRLLVRDPLQTCLGDFGRADRTATKCRSKVGGGSFDQGRVQNLPRCNGECGRTPVRQSIAKVRFVAGSMQLANYECNRGVQDGLSRLRGG